MKTDNIKQTEDTKKLYRLLERYSETQIQLQQIQADMDRVLLDAASRIRQDYVSLRVEADKVQAEIETLVKMHPEWFRTRRSIITPVGTVSLRSVTRLSVTDDHVTMRLIRTIMPDRAGEFIRTVESLNLEELDKLDERELDKLMVERVTEDSIKITPARSDIDRAIQAAQNASQ